MRNENQLQARKGIATRSTHTQRAVLGEIGNRVKGLSVNNGPKKAISADARKPLARSKATSSIRYVAKLQQITI